MVKLVHYGFLLALICFIAKGFLPTHAEEGNNFTEVMPEGKRFEPVKSGADVLYYKAYNQNGEFIGAVFKASGRGYSGVIETLTGLAKDLKINAVKVVSLNETPGVGGRVAEKSFTGQFTRKGIQDINTVQAITGATISSKAVMDSVKAKSEEVIRSLKNEGLVE